MHLLKEYRKYLLQQLLNVVFTWKTHGGAVPQRKTTGRCEEAEAVQAVQVESSFYIPMIQSIRVKNVQESGWVAFFVFELCFSFVRVVCVIFREKKRLLHGEYSHNSRHFLRDLILGR
ncbi:hypothetical protein PsorP6_011312 [Peronosclerospora sorghi]|uniref:Uncharacterized protein n=1 Tax=Peronosclerospora sorghi TaxID=230839 RepID=A0ACC0WJB0_9STRA|nr:hypothetical protein PsorP6_011312 [Peronosclerospora sorghi]